MNTRKSDNLRPCPFCGTDKTVDVHSIFPDKNECFLCGATAPNWNTRPIEDALNKRIAELAAYVDKLVAGLPEGMLPKDVEILREQNWKMAERIAELKGQLHEAHELMTQSHAIIVSSHDWGRSTEFRDGYLNALEYSMKLIRHEQLRKQE